MIHSTNGMLRAYDIISGRLLRAFNERSAPRRALRHLAAGHIDEQEEARWAVSCIIASRDGFVASVGDKILAWRAKAGGSEKEKASRSIGRSFKLDRCRGSTFLLKQYQACDTNVEFFSQL